MKNIMYVSFKNDAIAVPVYDRFEDEYVVNITYRDGKMGRRVYATKAALHDNFHGFMVAGRTDKEYFNRIEANEALDALNK